MDADSLAGDPGSHSLILGFDLTRHSADEAVRLSCGLRIPRFRVLG